jgi:isocitrate dehydrogenase
MFEAIHGSAPRRAGQNVANPSGLLQGAILMLTHLGMNEIAEKVQNAWLRTMEDGIHTYDVYSEGVSMQNVSTSDFAKAVIANLGNKPEKLKAVHYNKEEAFNLPKVSRKTPAKKDLMGVDLFVHWSGTNPDELAEKIKQLETSGAKLSMITNRGIKVWPEGFKETFCTDHWRCRFKPVSQEIMDKSEIVNLLGNALNHGVDTIKTENLYAFEGKPAFSLGQGQ